MLWGLAAGEVKQPAGRLDVSDDRTYSKDYEHIRW